jgi:glycosyltransferase involved in cell wall biosynthesis
MACAQYWTSPFQVGSHHLARGFVTAGYDVAFVSDPVSPAHLLQGVTRELRERWAIHQSGGIRDLADRLWAYVPAAPLTPHNHPLLRTEWVQRHWSRLTVPNVVEVVRGAGFPEVDFLYLDSVNQAFWLDAIPHRRSVLRIADRTTAFEKSTPASARLEREVARRVDLVVYTALSLRGYVESMGPRAAMHLPNGVDVGHFAGGDRTVPPDLAALPRPLALYVGAMDAWFDFALIQAAAEQLPHISFVLIGPDHRARQHLRPRPNLHLLGRRSYGELPQYLHHADVGLIPFDVVGHAELVQTIHPLKLYEYLASGLPVVAVEWEELRALRSPAVLCRTREEFIAAVEASVQMPRDRNAYLRFTERADWSARVAVLLARLGSGDSLPTTA